MRRLAAISLLLVFVALSSSATSIACVTNCAQMAPPATSTAPVLVMPMHHHHHAMPAPASQSFAATHCAGPATRLLAQRIVAPASADSAAPLLSVAPTVALSSRTAGARAPFAATPPGPPASLTQLRI